MKLVYGDILNEAWKSLRDDLPLVGGLTLVYVFGVWVLNLIPFLGYLGAAPLGLGYLRCLQQIRQKKVIGYEDFFWAFLNFNRFLHSVLMNILIAFGVTLGILLLIVPGVWFSVAVVFSGPAFLTQRNDAIEALRKSIETVKGRWWNIFGLVMVLFLVNLAGALCVLVGLLVSVPLSVLTGFIAFEKLISANPPLPSDGSFTKAETQESAAPVTILP